MGFRNDPFSYFEGQAGDAAISWLREYYERYAGRAFDRLAAHSDPGKFTPWDVVAVEMLSVSVPAEASIALIDDQVEGLERGGLSKLLALIPESASITDEEDHLSSEPALSLWRAVRGLSGLGRTTTSKLLAAKRPALFPIYDSRIATALLEDLNEDAWPLWRELFSDARGAEFVSTLREFGSRADVPPGVTELRIFDVVVWMSETVGG